MESEGRRDLEVESIESEEVSRLVESMEVESEGRRDLEVESEEARRVLEGESLEKARRALQEASRIHRAADSPAVEELEEAAQEFDSNYPFRMMENKMHRFPASLRAAQYVVPLVVAIGPYHHGLPRLQEMESVKRVAAYHCIRASGRSYEEVNEAFLSLADRARGLYADDAVAGINGPVFAAMMFHDACFLVQYIIAMSPTSTSPKSSIEDFGEDELFPRFLFSNRASINNDIMLLENQLPFQVLRALMYFLPQYVNVEAVELFTEKLANTFHIHQGLAGKTGEVSMPPEPMLKRPHPHLLGLFRWYKTGAYWYQPVHDGVKKQGAFSVPVSATELAGIGIKLRRSTDLGDMKIRKGALFDDFFLAPLYLDSLRTCWLVNMAALELCMTSSFTEGTAPVCSYLALLGMLMSREEDVHHVRAKSLLLGELTDKQMLSFFNAITEKIYPGSEYFRILADIEASKRRRWVRIMLHKFLSDNSKTIAAVLSVIGVLVGIFKALLSLNQHKQ